MVLTNKDIIAKYGLSEATVYKYTRKFGLRKIKVKQQNKNGVWVTTDVTVWHPVDVARLEKHLKLNKKVNLLQ